MWAAECIFTIKLELSKKVYGTSEWDIILREVILQSDYSTVYTLCLTLVITGTGAAELQAVQDFWDFFLGLLQLFLDISSLFVALYYFPLL